MRNRSAFLLIGFLLALTPNLWAADPGVQIVQIRGSVDAAYERAIGGAIDAAEKANAEMVLIEIDSRGVVGAGRAERIADRISNSEVPVVAWIGPAGARLANGAVLVVEAADRVAMSPGSSLGPIETLDLKQGATDVSPVLEAAIANGREVTNLPETRISADAAERSGLVNFLALNYTEIFTELNGTEISGQTLNTDPAEVVSTLRKTDLVGRVQHGTAQASIAYLLILTGLVGVVFEIFHPSNGPGGVSGAIGVALGVWGFVTLGGSPLALALLFLGVVGFCVDLKFFSLSYWSFAGFALLTAGSLLLFPSPHIAINPWVLVLGIGGMTAFLMGTMTKVLRDLKLLEAGEIEVTDPHPH